ncbi:MAG TPA: hypothetical protein VF785_00515 [Gemmatimonadaceae bacterium]
MSSSSRRWIAALIRTALVVLAIVLVSGYFARHWSGRRHVRVQTEVPPPDSLGPGDLRIYNADSSVDLILVGDKILAGLSPKTVAKVKGELETSASHDTGGLGGSISQIVKKSVAGAIGTHAVFPLSDIRDIRYDRNQIVFDWKDGGKHQLFGSTKVNGEKVSNTFRPEDAQRFIDAVHARMGQR